MRCDRVSPLIEELFDGEISDPDRALVEEHIAACADCAALHRSLELESQAYAGYERGFEPGDAMWDGILSRIQEESAPAAKPARETSNVFALFGRRVHVPRFAALAMAACLLVVTGMVAVSVLRNNEGRGVETTGGGPSGEQGRNPEPLFVAPENPGPVPPVAPPIVPDRDQHSRPVVVKPRPTTPKSETSALPDKVANAELDYVRAIAVLNKEVDLTGKALDPALRDKLHKPLTAIDKNIETAREAVRKNPNDPAVVLNMFAAYDDKVDVLQQLARYQVAQNR